VTGLPHSGIGGLRILEGGGMAKIVLEFTEEEQMRIEAILMDDDAQLALRFLKEIIKPKMRNVGSRALDRGRPTGIKA